MKLVIEKLDYEGQGVTHIDGKVCFVKRALPEEEVEAMVLQDKKHFTLMKTIQVFKKSERRVSSFCSYADICGGCTYDIISYEDSLLAKKKMVEELFEKANLNFSSCSIIPSKEILGYRNKISLKVSNGCIGYYEEETHQFVAIENCLLAKPSIQSFLKDIAFCSLSNGDITIRANYNDELLISINSDKEPLIDKRIVERHKIAGILWNGKCVYNNSFFFEKRDNLLYKVHAEAFFQINEDIPMEIWKMINKYFNFEDTVFDFYCGVGFFSLLLANVVKKVIGIEENPRAILDANYNAQLNMCNNVSFHVGKVEKVIEKIPYTANKVLVDPPRAGLHKNVVEKLLNNDFELICYVSCNPRTLCRDLQLLQQKYDIKELKLFDMFPYTKHVEVACCLSRKERR